jgi:hypothetical protein
MHLESHMNLRDIGRIVKTAGMIVGEVGTLLAVIGRAQHRTRSGPLLLIGAGIAIGALATNPAVRRKVRELFEEAPGSEEAPPPAIPHSARADGADGAFEASDAPS